MSNHQPSHTGRRSFFSAALAGALPLAAAPEKDKDIDQISARRKGSGLIAADHQRSAGGYTLFAPQTDNIPPN